MCKHTASRGAWGHAPRKFLYFRLSHIPSRSGAFSGSIMAVGIFTSDILRKLTHFKVTIGKWAIIEGIINTLEVFM